MNMDNFSEIPIWRIFAVIVMMAAVCPGGSVSKTEIGWQNRALRYARRIAADMRILAIRKPNCQKSACYAGIAETESRYNSNIIKQKPPGK